MTWNDVVSNGRQKLRRGVARDSEQQIPVGTQGARLEQLGEAPIATPRADVYESDKELLIRVDVPGGTRDGTVVAWDEGRGLTVLVKNQGLPSGSLWASEYQPHDWYRAFELPDHVDGSKASSTLKNGVLTLTIPKRAAASKRIPVRAG